MININIVSTKNAKTIFRQKNKREFDVYRGIYKYVYYYKHIIIYIEVYLCTIYKPISTTMIARLLLIYALVGIHVSCKIDEEKPKRRKNRRDLRVDRQIYFYSIIPSPRRADPNNK